MRCAERRGEETTRGWGLHRRRRRARARPGRPCWAAEHQSMRNTRVGRPRKGLVVQKEWCRAGAARTDRRGGAAPVLGGRPPRPRPPVHLNGRWACGCPRPPRPPPLRASSAQGAAAPAPAQSGGFCLHSVEVLLHRLHQGALGHGADHRVHLLACRGGAGRWRQAGGWARAEATHTTMRIRGGSSSAPAAAAAQQGAGRLPRSRGHGRGAHRS